MIAMMMMLLNQGFGSGVIAIYLAIWVGYAALIPMRAIHWLLTAVVPWLFPMLALASVTWSGDPGISARAALELIAATGTAIIMARALSVRQFTSAFAAATVIVCLYSVVSGRVEASATSGDSLAGIFGSKNQLAYSAGLAILGSLGVLLSEDQPVLARLCGLGGALACTVALWRAHSVGALGACAGAVGICLACGFARTVPAKWRGALVASAVIVSIALGVFAIDYTLNSGTSALRLVGKDPSLTGRTMLWAAADRAIEKHPVFGMGYQDFWVVTSPEAHALWIKSHQTPGPGFHFHNLAYESTVELGYVGLFVMFGTLLSMTFNALIWQLRYPDGQSPMFFALCCFFLLRCYVEVDFVFPFSIAIVILPGIYLYTKAGARGRFTTAHRLAWRASLMRRRPAPARLAAVTR